MLPRPLSHSHALGPGVAGPELLLPVPYAVDPPPKHSLQQPVCGNQAFFVDPKALADSQDPIQHTKYPYVTGASVMGIKYKDGVLVACDTLGSYGTTKRYKSVERVKKVNDKCVIAAGGELSDFQYICKLLDELVTDDYRMQDGIELSPAEVYAYLCRVMHNRRNKFDPLWNSLVIAGVQPDGSFLGTVGMIGTHYVDSHVTTGFASQLARPLFREHHRDDMSEEEAVTLLRDALRVCYYRDKVSINKFTMAKVTAEGVAISAPFSLDMQWSHKLFEKPTHWAIGSW